MKEDFYITLLSNSSMTYYPQNTTSHFITKLPQHVTLEGEWLIGLTEIQIPLTFQHVSKKLQNTEVMFAHEEKSCIAVQDLEKKSQKCIHAVNNFHFDIPSGLYDNVDELLKEINKNVEKSHLEFSREAGGYVCIKKMCECENKDHFFKPTDSLKKILGFRRYIDGKIFVDEETVGNCPANLNSGLPSSLLIYSDLCAPYITGDVYTRLLRNVTINFQKYNYGSIMVKNFSPPNYFALLNSSFQTIEIDIRDEFVKSIPFDYGTVTVTLHFKRLR